MDDSGRPPVPHPPYDELHAAAGEDAAREHIAALRSELESPRPDPDTVAAHADRLRGFRDLEARIATWWESPATQRWIKALSDANL